MNCCAVCSDFTPYNIKRSSSSSSADTIAQGWKFNNWPEPKIEERFQPDMVDLTLFLDSVGSVGSVGSAENKIIFHIFGHWPINN